MNQRNRAKMLTTSALFAALLAVTCPFVLPLGAIGITLATAVLLFLSLTVKPGEAIIATSLYLALGAIGLPVFSQFTGGIGAFVAPSGGFLIGYLPFVAITALAKRHTSRALAMSLAIIAAHLVLYALGATVFALNASCSLAKAITLTVLPFLLPDAVKALLATYLARLTASRRFR